MTTRKCGVLASALFLATALMAFSTDVTEVDQRISDAENHLREMKTLLAGTTNEIDRQAYQARVTRATDMLSNVQELARMQEEEERFTTKQRTSTAYVLLEALATIDTNTNEPIQEIQAKNTDIRRLKRLRSDLIARVESPQALRIDTEKLHNLDAELLARTLERDAAQLRLRLAREADRIDTDYRSQELNPRPTVRLLHLYRQNISNTTRLLEELGALRKEYAAQRESTAKALDLAKEQAVKLEAEIGMLRTQRDSLRRDEKDLKDRLNNMLNEVSAEKDILTTRLIHIPAQLAAIDIILGRTQRGIALFDAERAFHQEDYLELRRRFVERITLPFALCIAIGVIYTLLSRLVFPLVFKRDALFVARRMGGYFIFVLIVIILISFFLEDLKAIATVMGIVGAAVVIALQDLCSSFAGWFVIVASRKLKVGDRVEIDDHRGDIIDIQILRITLIELNNWMGVDEPTGRVVIVPNSFIFKSKVFNYSHIHPYIWGCIPITITFETPPQEAYDTLLKVLTEETTEEFAAAEHGGHMMIEQYGLVRTTYEPHIHTVIADSGITYTLFYVTHYRRNSATKDKISARILKEFEANPRLQFAYPTERHIVNKS